MKEYGRYVIWVDYFDSELKRSQGRRVPLSSATKAPRVEELDEACRRLNLQGRAEAAQRPGNPLHESGYVSVMKVKPKHALISKIAKELAFVRSQSLKRQQHQGRKK